MRYFCTNDPTRHNVHDTDEIKLISVEEALQIRKSMPKLVALDTETNSLDFLRAELLLCQIGYPENQLVIDCTSVDARPFIAYGEFILHNGKYDDKILFRNLGVKLTHYYDTMVMDQIVYKGNGISPDNRNGYKFNFLEVVTRHLGYEPEDVDKTTRSEFDGMNPKSCVFTNRHIVYASSDVKYLHIAREKQLQKLRSGNCTYDELSKYLLPAVADIELAGWGFNQEQWKSVTQENREKAYQYACKLDDLVRQYRKKLPEHMRQRLTGGIYDRPRPKPFIQQQHSLFDINPTESVIDGGNGNVNWKSSQQVLTLCAILGIHMPIERSKDVPFAVPKLLTTRSNGKIKETYNASKYAFTTNAKELTQMLIAFPGHPAREFIETLVKYREAIHMVSAFGDNFIENVDSNTGRIHTIFRTDRANNHRFQSGQKGTRFTNFQNIPRDNRLRNCFIARPGYLITNNDLSGAEVTIMCDKANDKQLYEWAVKNDDAHSPIATACWRNVYLYRAGLMANCWSDPKQFRHRKNQMAAIRHIANNQLLDIQENWQLYNDFVINKETNKHMRQSFKNVTFAVPYGAYTKKVAQLLNIPGDEGQVVIDTIHDTIPNTMKYVERCAEMALQQGYLVIEDRWNTRVWFPHIIHAKRYNTLNELDWKVARDVTGLARNVTISGTQALMIKEAIVEISLYNKYYSVDARILGTVHDELNIEFQQKYTDEPIHWFSDKAKKYYDPQRPLYLPLERKHRLDAGLIREGLVKQVPYPEFVQLTMIESANRYLKHFTMGSSIDVAPYWLK